MQVFSSSQDKKMPNFHKKQKLQKKNTSHRAIIDKKGEVLKHNDENERTIEV